MNATPDKDVNTIAIIGAGPVGMLLSLELARHKCIKVILIEREKDTTIFPKMEVVNSRTLEFLKRIDNGMLLQKIRERGNSVTDKFVKKFYTPSAKWELGSWVWNSVAEQQKISKFENNGTKSPEPYCRISQYLMEPILMERCLQDPYIAVTRGEEFIDYVEHDTHVVLNLRNIASSKARTINTKYLVGCDG